MPPRITHKNKGFLPPAAKSTLMTTRLRLTRLELLAMVLGAFMGLVASAPLLWLTAEAHRTGNLGLSRAAQFYVWELTIMWLGGQLTGGLIAAALSRRLSPGSAMAAADNGKGPWTQHLLHLALGTIIIMILAPAPAALVLALIARQADALVEFYLVGGGLIGWQAGVITFVFLYTFKTVEHLSAQRSPSA